MNENYRFKKTKCCFTCDHLGWDGDSRICKKRVAFCYYRNQTGRKVLMEGKVGLSHSDSVLHVCGLHEFNKVLNHDCMKP